MATRNRSKLSWFWSTRRVEVSYAELLQLRAFQLGSAIVVVAYVLRATVQEVVRTMWP
jgi:hypothetical protein